MPNNDEHSAAPHSHGRGAGGEGAQDRESNSLPMHMGAEPYQFSYAREMRGAMTAAEEALWQHLRARRFLNLKFRRQHPLLDFVVDFYCHEVRLVIEADGGYHEDPESQQYDKERTKELNKYGITVVRFRNNEILNEIDSVLRKLKKKVNELKSTSPRPSPGRRG